MTSREAGVLTRASDQAGAPCPSGPAATGIALSAACPAFRVVLTRAGDVCAVLHDRTMSADPRTSRPGSFSRLLFGVDDTFRPTMLHLDDPDHERLAGAPRDAAGLAAAGGPEA